MDGVIGIITDFGRVLVLPQSILRGLSTDIYGGGKFFLANVQVKLTLSTEGTS